MSLVVIRVVTRVHLCVSPEGGGSLFLRKVGVYLQLHTALQPARTSKTETCVRGRESSHLKKLYRVIRFENRCVIFIGATLGVTCFLITIKSQSLI